MSEKGPHNKKSPSEIIDSFAPEPRTCDFKFFTICKKIFYFIRSRTHIIIPLFILLLPIFILITLKV